MPLPVVGLLGQEVLGGVVMLISKRRRRITSTARLPPVARLVVRGWGVGAVLGAAFAMLLVVTNVGGLHDLMGQTPDAVTAISLLVVGFATLFAGLYSGAAVMLLSSKDD
jgi:hypothetical protein